MKFELDQEQIKKYKTWRKTQDAEAAKRQLESGKFEDNPVAVSLMQSGRPYCGAIGGGVTFSFTPTGLGDICNVTHALTGETLHLTDYDSW